MTAWAVRAGRKGEHEQRNLERSCTTIRWAEVGDLSACSSPNNVKAVVGDAYKGEPQGRFVGSTSQLWNSFGGIDIGDVVFMPSKLKRGLLYVGRVPGAMPSTSGTR